MSHPDKIGVAFADGNMTPVLRFGDRVRRTRMDRRGIGPAVLRHLENAGFDGAPRMLELDDTFEWLSYIPGQTVPSDLKGYADDSTLEKVITKVRDLHGALASFDTSTVTGWPVMPGMPAGTAICHNDLAPWNTIFDERAFRAFIDWDLVGLGPRLWDLAYVAWTWVPFWATEDDEVVADRGRRLRLVLERFGTSSEERSTFLDLVRQRQQCSYDAVEAWGREGQPGWEKLWREGHHRGTLNDVAWLARNRDALSAYLVGP